MQGKFVAEAMCVIAANTDAPVSVKCRIGVDDHDSYEQLCKFFYLFIFLFSSIPPVCFIKLSLRYTVEEVAYGHISCSVGICIMYLTNKQIYVYHLKVFIFKLIF